MPERRGRMGKKRRDRQSRSSSSDGMSTEETRPVRSSDIDAIIEAIRKDRRKEAEGIKQKLEEQKEELKEEINKIHRQLNELSHIVQGTQLEQPNGSSGDGSPAPRSETNQMQPPTFLLKFESEVGNTVEKGKSITIKVKMYDGGNPIREKLKDGRPHPLASAKVMMVVLDGKFNDNRSNWSKEDFEKSIKTSTTGDVNQGIVRNCVFYLNGGTGHHSGATICENSGNSKVKLGVMVLLDDSYEEYKNERVLEGVSEGSFLVRDPPRTRKKQKEAVEHFQSPLAEQAPVGCGQERNGPMPNTQYSSWPTLNTQTAGNSFFPPSLFSSLPLSNDADHNVSCPVSGQPLLQAYTNVPSSSSTPRDITLGADPQRSVEPSTNQQPSSFSEGHHHISAGVQTPVISGLMNQTMHSPDGGVQTYRLLDHLRHQPIRSPIGYPYSEHIIRPVQLLWDRPGVEPRKRWNLLDQLMPPYISQTKIHSGDFPTMRLIPEHYEQALFLKLMRDLLSTTIPKEVMQTHRNRGVLIQPLEPDDSDDEPPLKTKLRNKYQLQFVNKVCEAYYTWEQIKADDGNLLNVALYDENNAKITSGPLSSASVEVVVLHGDFNATGQDYWTSEEFSRCVVCPQSRKEPPAIGGDRVLLLVDGEASLGDAFFQKSSIYARSGKFKLGAKMKFTLEGRIQEGITESFFVRNRQGEGGEVIQMREGEVIQLLNLVGSVLVKICGMIAEDTSLKGELKNGLESIGREMRTIIADIKEGNNHGATEERFLLLQELAYDIEDFIDGLWEPGASGPILTAIGLDSRPQDLGRIDYFKSRIESLRKSQPSALRQLRGDNTAKLGPSAGSPPYTPEAELMGIAKPKAELLELLSEADGWQPQQLRVISIVGFRGLGKTALARAVYNDTHVAYAFSCRAWVVASEYNNAEDLLNEIHQLFVPTAGPDGTSSGNLHDILKDKRYLVVLDDVQRAEVWKEIERAFPKNGNSSRIIVTTSLRSVANACSSGSYVYTMQYLRHDKSEDLSWRKFDGCEPEPAPSLVDGSKSILDKCGGLPLALISAANYLGQNPRSDCEVLGQALGDCLAGNEPAFGAMRRALVQCYDSLPDYGHKTCLLSLSIFPRGPRMNRKSLVRRWIAEGLVVGGVQLNEEEIACQRLKELIDRSIIEPVLVSNGPNKVVERCQVHSVMLEFIIHKSVSNNFVTLIHEDKLLRNNNCRVRRLSVQNSSNEGGGWVTKEIDLSSIRSLTICSSYIFDFKDCKLLRVLDLEGCNGITERVLDVICKLRFLKYLSLRGSNVPRIPQRMGKLYDLETLDIRETQVKILPVEVIKLPRLAHLFGRFELSRVSEEMSDELKKGSLQTLAGVVIDKEHTGFEQIMLHARRLSKVKIWYNATPRGNNSTHPNKKAKCINSTVSSLLSSLQKRFTGSKALDTLSIDSSDLSKEFLRSLAEASCVIRAIKLRGKLERLPDSDTLRQLRYLNKLHLFSTGLSSEVLSELQTLRCLEYLKLAEDPDGFSGSSFVVDRDGFPSLQRLCFEAPKLPLLQIEQGAMTKLTSLQMLCQEFADGLGVTGIEHLQRLDEVILYSYVSDEVMEAWKRAAIQHQNRPSVKKQQINDAA